MVTLTDLLEKRKMVKLRYLMDDNLIKKLSGFLVKSDTNLINRCSEPDAIYYLRIYYDGFLPYITHADMELIVKDAKKLRGDSDEAQ